MYLTSLAAQYLGPLTSFQLDGISPTGVTIIHGDNEKGKSSIMQAVKIALTEKHTSTKGWIKALATAGAGESIRIELGMNIDGIDTIVKKKLNGGAKASLAFPGTLRPTATGTDVHDELQKLLQENVDLDLAHELFIEQGTIDTQVDALAISSVQKALDSGAEQPASGETDLVASVWEEAREYLTPSGSPKKFVKDAEKNADVARAHCEELKRKARAMDETVEGIARLRRSIDEFHETLPKLKKDVRGWEEKKEALAELEKAVRDATAVAVEARHRSDSVKNACEQRRKAIAEAEERKQTLVQDSEILTDLEQKAASIAEKVAAAQERKTGAQESAKKARAAVRVAERAIERKHLHEERDRLARVVEKAREISESIAEKKATLAAVSVTTANLRALEKAESDAEVARATREAAAATVTLHNETDEPLSLRIDDEDVTLDAEDSSLPVASLRTIRYRGLRASVQPARGADSLNATVEKAEGKLAELLESVNCATVEEARAIHDRDEATLREIEKLELQRKEIVGDSPLDQSQAELDRLTRVLREEDESTMSTGGTDAGGADDTTKAAADRGETSPEKSIEELRDEADEADRQLEIAEAALSALQNSTAPVDYAVHKKSVERSEAEYQRIAQQVAAEEEAQSLADLEKSSATVAAEAYEAEQFVRVKEAELSDAQPELIDGRLDVARSKVENAVSGCQQAEIQLAAKTSEVESARGLAEEVDEAEAEAKAAEDKSARLSFRATVYARLLAVLEQHKKQAYDAYAEPLTKAINDLATVIFGPDVHFTLDENMKLAQRVEDGVAIGIEQLSGGAREQLTLIVRLALAEVAARNGEQVPIFIDDFLGHSDQQRLDDMAALINRISSRHQIFILTCFPSRFSGVRNARTVSIDELTARTPEITF